MLLNAPGSPVHFQLLLDLGAQLHELDLGLDWAELEIHTDSARHLPGLLSLDHRDISIDQLIEPGFRVVAVLEGEQLIAVELAQQNEQILNRGYIVKEGVQVA